MKPTGTAKFITLDQLTAELNGWYDKLDKINYRHKDWKGFNAAADAVNKKRQTEVAILLRAGVPGGEINAHLDATDPRRPR
jgi:hypothetical protein